MLSELQFGSFLTYVSKATTDAEKNAKQWMYRIKSDQSLQGPGIVGTISTARLLAERLSVELPKTALGAVLTPQSVLVPVPGSSLQKPGSLWVAERLASALVEKGLAAEVFPCVKRVVSVPKSAFAQPGQRPSMRTHYDSFGPVEGNLLQATSFVLIDDVLTRGSTMIAAASRIADAFPKATIAGFAMLRTMGYVSPFVQLVDPVIGRITLDGWGKASRNP